MQIYNTLTKKKEEFKPLNPPKVRMYVCGPTIYDFFHIGNARSFIMADILRKYLIYKGYDVTYAMNLTDVDDKIIKKANNEGIETTDVTKKYGDAFFEDTGKLGVEAADIHPRATEHMGEIIEMIKTLVEKDVAYNVNGNVFYDVAKFEGYGKLSGKKIDELESGARIEVNPDKRNPLDFALWKKAKEGEPSWDSPWGKGRPGWHIECSAMSTKHLGDEIDIHAGGHDLIFPHHENEIAQSEAAHGKEFVKYWVHFGFLNIDNEKMSKSLGNFFTARDILKQYDKETIRFFLCQTHYSQPLNFSEDGLKSAKTGLAKLNDLAERIVKGMVDNVMDGEAPKLDMDKFEAEFEEAMDDDFNTSRGIAVIFNFIKEANKALTGIDKVNVTFYGKLKEFLVKTAQGVLGIVDFEKVGKQDTASDGKLEDELINMLIEIRAQAKGDKNYGMADTIRDGLKDLGIELKDSKTGTTYKKTN